MNRLPKFGTIVLMIANQADRQLLAELLQQTGYSVQLLDNSNLTQSDPAGSLFIIDEPSARRHGDALFDLKRRLQPLYFPMLLALANNARSTPWLRAGFDDVLRLPLSKDDLLARLEAFLRLRQHSEDMLNESTRRFHATFDLAPVGIVQMAFDGRLLLANPQFCDTLGYSESELLDLTMQHMVHPEDIADIQSTIDALLDGHEAVVHRFDKRYCCKNRDVIWAAVSISLVRDGDGQPTRLVAAIEDITARKQMEKTLRESERFIKSTIDALSKHICVTDEAGNILAVNKAWHDFASANGMSPDTVWEQENYFVACNHASGMGAQDAGVFAAGMREVASGMRNEFRMEYICHSPAEQRWFIAKVTRFPGDGLTRLVIAHENITQAKLAEKELLYLAHYDSLTGLPNRALLQDRLHQAIAHANRYSHQVWILFLDLDRFKPVNDTLGHKAGDHFLQEIGRRLQEATRESDTVARFGGDEFIMILSEPGEEHLTMGVLRRIMTAVAQPLTIEGQEFSLTCSMGIAIYPDDGLDPEVLVDHADLAMYRAKELGSNGYQFYAAAMNEMALKRLHLERHLRNALECGEFVLHYQPQVDLRTGKIVGMEALIRWQHPELGMVPPADFIGLAEETGLIVPIGLWVIRTACAQNMTWQRAGLGNLRMAVNLSARQFAQHDLVQSVAAILEETGLAPQYLDIELTETVVMTEVEQTIDILRALKDLGVQLSIDDFGTGYSSLSYLKRFPIDVLKIDQSFVRDIMHDPGSAAIPNAIISMAHSLGIEVVAEGVETEAQCDYLSRNMCDEIQGFWFSKPLAPDNIEALLRENRRLPSHLLRMQKPPRTLLLVDDEPHIVSSLKRLLRHDGYQILTAHGGQEGLEILARHKVDVILTDQRMPGMTGVEFLRTAKILYPETMRIVLSGYTELQSITDAINEGAIYRFLSKPWDDGQLRQHLTETFEYKEMADENRRLHLKVQTANAELAASNRQLRLAMEERPAWHESPEPVAE